MNILVDGRTFCAPSAGITTVLRCVLQSWGSLFQGDQLYVILPKQIDKALKDEKFPSNVYWLKAKASIFKKLPNLVYVQLMAPFFIKKYKIDVYYSPIPSMPYLIPKDVKKLIAINDVVNIEFKSTMTITNKIANAILFGMSVKKANQLWAISNYTKKKIEEYYPNRRCKNIFVGCATDRSLYRKIRISADEERKVKDKYEIKDKFVLFVGSLEPRKNLTFLLDIIPKIYCTTGIQLVVVGAKGWKNSRIKEKVMADSFPKESTIFCGYVSNDDLVKLYNIANCFVSSSLNEGFGLPQLEAFLCGCPVVTSANSAMIEVAGGKKGGFLIDGYDEEEWITTIVNCVKNRPEVEMQQFANYHWDVVVNAVREIL